jgi:hypothetical protein
MVWTSMRKIDETGEESNSILVGGPNYGERRILTAKINMDRRPQEHHLRRSHAGGEGPEQAYGVQGSGVNVGFETAMRHK